MQKTKFLMKAFGIECLMFSGNPIKKLWWTMVISFYLFLDMPLIYSEFYSLKQYENRKKVEQRAFLFTSVLLCFRLIIVKTFHRETSHLISAKQIFLIFPLFLFVFVTGWLNPLKKEKNYEKCYLGVNLF